MYLQIIIYYIPDLHSAIAAAYRTAVFNSQNTSERDYVFALSVNQLPPNA